MVKDILESESVQRQKVKKTNVSLDEDDEQTISEVKKPPNGCDTCGKICTSKHYLEMHMQRTHVQQKCDLCDFSGLYLKLKEHMKQKHPEHKPYKCDKCSITYGLQLSLKWHKLDIKLCQSHIKSLENKQESICETCGEVFQTARRLAQHNIRIHKKQEEKNHICEYCGAAYSKANILKVHVNRYHTPKCYICILCDHMVTKRTGLLQHQTELHNFVFKGRRSRDIYPCETCQQRFESTSDLDAHFANEHKQIQNNRCEDCDKVLVSKTLLLAHKMEFHQFNPIAPLLIASFCKLNVLKLLLTAPSCE